MLNDFQSMVHQKSYAREKADGTKESWADTVERVARGNCSLDDALDASEYAELKDALSKGFILPGGRHVWATGTERPFISNCFVSGWQDGFIEHYKFLFHRLA